jgi:hypothetical protein
MQRRRPEQHIGEQPGDVDRIVRGEGVGLGEDGEDDIAGEHGKK